ncbi:putative effector protein/Carbohydrate esterase family 4 protein [Ceratobasidium theobromae]|uniref:Putative effector protein/Carbohydrate esterase family 4 protein n=1 Tax=Ceratobasidium theobromae TaxID=1582974 RepID=A0A5N5QD41_9AGAM|nr:putative effector protein/Carbohydrate esterase family 4 protein [Ceratobasidium theobromae]
MPCTSHLLAFAAALCGVVHASTNATSSNLHGRALARVITKCTKSNTVAITFDDGPHYWTTNLVDMLNNNDAKATFFFNGDNYGCIYDSDNAQRVKYAYDQGHQVASHTWAHDHLTQISEDDLRSQFTRTNTAIKKITGAVPAFVRPPYGEYNDLVRQVASDNGQSLVIWDFDSGDSVGVSAADSKKKYKQLLDSHPNAILTLNHETYESTVNNVIPYAIQQIKAKGYRMVTVAECVGASPYKSRGNPSRRDSSWAC